MEFLIPADHIFFEWAPVGHFKGLSGPGGIPYKLAHRPPAICYRWQNPMSMNYS